MEMLPLSQLAHLVELMHLVELELMVSSSYTLRLP